MGSIVSKAYETGATTMTALLWYRRDLRTRDHPALLQAVADGPVLGCYVLDPAITCTMSPPRLAWLAATLRALDRSWGGRLHLLVGDPETVIPTLAAEAAATSVHVSAETEPDGRGRDSRLRTALASHGVAWVETGSPYAVAPGRLVTRAGGGFAVFSAYQRAWRTHGVRPPAPVADLRFARPRIADDSAARALLNRAESECRIVLPAAGEAAAAERWRRFLADKLTTYAELRDRPDQDGTSRLSADLALGTIHPRSLLFDLATRAGAGTERFISELAWREFFADVLSRNSQSLTSDLKELPLPYDEPGAGFSAWCAGRTGYPLVDAGQRQLVATGWMHNRVRMISASFLTKDLHMWWPHGARFFAEHLLDLDAASNAHSWQWVAGTGTDAAPYFRVFNPSTQAARFDPPGDYVRRWIPELAHLKGAAAHRPWDAPDGAAGGYPSRILDHDAERVEALSRYRQARMER